jgi:hypothetical protein
MNGNTVETVIPVAETYQAIDLTGMVRDASTELWTLIDAVDGVFRYEGLHDFVGTLAATIWAVKSGGTTDFRFAASINGAIPVFLTAFYAPLEVKTTKVQATVLKPISVSPGDTVQLMVAEVVVNDNITITDIAIDIKV